MRIALADEAANAMLDALTALLDGGSIELYSDDQRKLAVLKLSDPAAREARSGEVEFNAIGEEDAALALGRADKALVLDSSGETMMTCDVGDGQSDAVVKLNTTEIFPGGPVRIKSFRLAMP